MKDAQQILILVFCLLFTLNQASAQQPVSRDHDNLNSIAEDLTLIGKAEGLAPRKAVDTVALDTVPKKKAGLIRRIVDYYSRSNVDRTFEKRIDWSIAPGPSYSSDVGFGLGFLLAGLYRIDRTDSTTFPSNISIYGNFTTKKFVLLRCSGENNYNHNRQRFNYSGAFVYFPGAFYGVGYEDGKQGYSQKLTTTTGLLRLSYCTAILPKAFIGLSGGIDYSGTQYAKSGIVKQLEEIKEGVVGNPGGTIGELYELWTQGRYNPALQDPFTNYIESSGDKPNAFNANLGIFFQYDSRDVPFNAHKGVFLKVEAKWYPRFFGNTGRNFGRFSLTLDWYQQLWKGGVLAYDLYADGIAGTPSWHMYAKLGGMERMRGYYEGRYRDKRMVETQIELRQKIYRRHGVVGWFGLGNIWGQQKFRWDRSLYSFGVGYRFEFKNRMNIRLDYGWGNFGNSNLPWDRKRSSAFLFTASEAF